MCHVQWQGITAQFTDESHVANALRAIFRDSFIVGLNALLGKSSMRYKLPSIFLLSKIELNIKIELRVD